MVERRALAACISSRDRALREPVHARAVVPIDMPVIKTSAPWQDEIVIGSSVRLLDELSDINDQMYRVRPEERADLKPSARSFDDAARFGLAILLALAQESVAHRLPLKLDY